VPLVKAGEQLPGFALLRDDGSTSCGNWIYCGVWSQAGNLSARVTRPTPPGWACSRNWGYSWPANRRILYNRASADKDGKPWDPSRKYLAWNGKSWAGGADVPDMRPDAAPEQNVGAFIMNPEGVARLHAIGMAEGPFPEHYEPFETPVGVNLMCPTNPKAVSNPAARVYKGDLEAFGKKEEFPYAATTYRLTEHLHFWTKHSRSNAVTQPAPFVEIGEELAKEKGIKQGDKVKVRSNRGEVIAACVVTKRMKGLDVNGKKVHHVGIPIHWGFKGVTQNGYLANALTPFVGDANSQTPEFKAFLVNIEKVVSHGKHAITRRGRPLGHHHAVAAGAHQRAAGRQAHRRVQVHRLQGLPGGLHELERPARRGRHQHRRVRQPQRPDADQLDGDEVLRGRAQGGQPRVADPQGRLHALRGPRAA
jgi:hypothetical protein